MEFEIEIVDLNLFYASKQILKDIDLKIPRNKITAIIGPSGCGKSSLLKCINRLIETIPEARIEGKIYLEGEDIYSENTDVTEVRRRIGMVFQKPNPFPKSIFDNVAYGLRINGVKDKKIVSQTVEKTLKDCGLWEEVKDRLSTSALRLSGGQQQRLCIARALAIKPQVLLLDEPCSALDPASTFRIEELIRKLKEEYTFLLVTHNMQQAARVSDFTGFLHLGEIIEFGETTQIFRNPQNELTERYISGHFG